MPVLKVMENRIPRPVHARRREGEKCKAATTAIKTIPHER